MKNFLKQIIRPFSIIKLDGMAFFIWVSFTLFGGLIGIIVSLFRNALFGEKSLLEALLIESEHGSFYTYSIAMVAGVLSSVFITFIERKKLNFRRHIIVVLTISIFTLFFGGVFYALSINSNNETNLQFDYKVIVILIIAILISIYSFCICRLDSHPESFQDIMDENDEIVKNTEPKSSEISNDSTEQ